MQWRKAGAGLWDCLNSWRLVLKYFEYYSVLAGGGGWGILKLFRSGLRIAQEKLLWPMLLFPPGLLLLRGEMPRSTSHFPCKQGYWFLLHSHLLCVWSVMCVECSVYVCSSCNASQNQTDFFVDLWICFPFRVIMINSHIHANQWTPISKGIELYSIDADPSAHHIVANL